MKETFPETVTIQILGREYKLRCPPDECDALLTAAQWLDTEMRIIRSQQGQAMGAEKIAIMAALKVTHELVQLQKRHGELQNRLSQRLSSLNSTIDTVLKQKVTDPV